MAEGLVLTEQRNLTRRELIYYLKIVDRKTGRELGRMGDIHGEGMLVLGRPALEPGTVYDSLLELPKALQDKGAAELHLKFEAVWARPGPKNSNFEESGAKFMSLSPSQRQMIERLIELFAMPVSEH
ncbi:hypothetical protein C4J81_04615 [Deltaproteobacteria bacterium Smac51]|nr:hypothetical protein C4J81_04615 [Deltaproteobacteria bacterium Smac51]